MITLHAFNREVLLPSPFDLECKPDIPKTGFRIIKAEKDFSSGIWINNFGERKEIPDNYNQVKIFLENKGLKINFICRAYNEGVAFAYEFPEQDGLDSLTITDEKILFRFPADYPAWSAARAQAQYSHVPLSKIEKGCERPLVIEIDTTLIIALAEAKLIDFTSSHNMQYVEFDAGWYGPENNENSDPTNPVLDPARSKGPLNLDEIIHYADSKNIKVLLYVNRKALEKKLDDILPLFKKWGVAGIKFGFVQVGTQPVTAWMHYAIKKAADYGMVIDVHDEYRPTGFSRTYPNFLTMEGIRGDEESPSNSHTLITMFTRMLVGQGDNTICYFNERVDKKMGSHASQLAKAVCIFSPLQFLYWYDKAAPRLEKNDGLWGSTNYIGSEPELEFFDNVPTVWDETRVLHAKIGEYGVIVRRKGDEWFLGEINGEKARKLNISFSFLEPGVKYTASVYSDDPSVNTRTHVRIDRMEIDRNTVFEAMLGSNNGIAMHITPLK